MPMQVEQFSRQVTALGKRMPDRTGQADLLRLDGQRSIDTGHYRTHTQLEAYP
jgi:hypothetical protein